MSQVRLGLLAQLGLLAPPALPVLREPPGQLAQPDRVALMASLASTARKEPVVSLDLLDPLGLLAYPGSQALPGQLGLREQQARRVRLGLRVSPVLRALLALQVSMVLMDRAEQLASRELLVRLEPRALLVSLAQRVSRE